MGRKIYLENRSRDEALQNLIEELELTNFFVQEDEEILVDESLGRITSQPVYARVSTPHYRASAMDGVAVIASKTFGAAETNPVTLKLGADGVVVDTGDPIPDEFDAVIMIEHVNFIDDNRFQIIAPAFPWQHVRAIGEDMVKQEMLLPSNHGIRPYDVGAMVAANVDRVRVKIKPVVGIIPTGDELVEPGTQLKPGDIVEFNSRVMSGLVVQWHGRAEVFPIIPDKYDKIKEVVIQALDKCHIVVINAGSSAGRDDYTSSIIEELGRVYTHGIAIKPGKPVVLGIASGRPVIGIPGYPVSSALTFELFVKPLIYRKLGTEMKERQKVKVTVAKPLYSTLGMEEMIRVKIGRVGERLVAAPLERGAGVMMSLVRADGILRVPRLSEGIEVDIPVEAELLKPLGVIEKAVLMCGSHDLTLDVVNDLFHKFYPGYSLSSSHVGSLGGISALKRGEAHSAGMHLLDPETGEYNVSYVKRLLPDEEVLLVNLVYRQQGLMVAKGNPLKIRGLEALTEPNIKFINRQKGAGTRILLDYLLAKEGIKESQISGYRKEEYNHLAVAAAIAANTAHVGMGIMAAAQALDLDFVPLIEERYDICIPKVFLKDERIKKLLHIICSEEFKEQVSKLGGYGTKQTGKIVWSSFPVEEGMLCEINLQEI
ncbi:molybdopterin biosynthesis protein [Desulfitibacter alkalitolerans]|uniref:molybdopterin biosynthesis protein n=1 Tax=Desulfitibacter alkalitolerans TaxID=264641 RepID=UPI0006864EBD|nr:molybdopterin biosynthesis protein [Desulfitibacter alkalitolerans]